MGMDDSVASKQFELESTLKELEELAHEGARTREQRAAIQVELSTDELDLLYEQLTARGVNFHRPPQDHPWERSMQTYDPDGYTVEFAQGRRGHNRPA